MEFKKEVLPNISTVESVLKMPLSDLPIRSTLVKHHDRLVLISPTPNLHKVENDIKNWGLVTDIVAPNKFHNLGLKRAIEIFPNAKVWFPYGLNKKLKDSFVDVHKLETWEMGADLEAISLSGQPAMNEYVFYHSPTKTLICADLCFNVQKATGIGARIVFGGFGIFRRFGVSRLFCKLIREREIFAQSLKPLFKKDFENIIMAHGEIVFGNGKFMLQQSLAERGFK